MAQSSPHGGMGGSSVAMPKLGWKLPVGWTEQPPSTMRAASFVIKGTEGQSADVGVIPLRGVTGRDLEMVNLWRSQVQLEPAKPEDLESLTAKVSVAGGEGKLFDMVGKTPAEGQKSPLRALVAVLEREGTSWFFKMTGPDALVGEQKPAFLEFLKSVESRAGETVSTAMAAPSPAPAADAGRKPVWVVPAGWQEAPAGQFLVAKYVIAGADAAQATVNISMSAGEGGGLIGNVNRWRKQLGLEEQSPEAIAKTVTVAEASGAKVTFVELSGKDARSGRATRLVGAVAPLGDRTWFYKLMGDSTVVEAQQAAFTQFVQSAKY